ncbi:3-(3-hydroxyphenyl)propionate hydroxylase [Ktedonosporobacter rubrisoli]|uniref:3-(3-hydroxyphenyl)propionate hydroxylase n=1 Tax=Ktedonosporobacter rubrisoli TaxID=2509675 RepID=A0A4P6JJQ0_KTERU|nr:FAD-dependent monooxygenase [Ktedonosporobacter rubrisoli]QBD75354.1 3-(3-hydroxyphenyl)propionate hydroxylase [Ktedonosporobacter rubrisoli]
MTNTPNNIFDTDVLIVGAGPVGLTLAIELARRGIACRVIDQLATYPIGTRARGVSARTQEIFDNLSIIEDLQSYIEPRLPWRFYDGAGRLVQELEVPVSFGADHLTPDRPYPGNVLIAQQHTEAVLRKHLSSYGQHVELDCTLTNFWQDAEQVVAEVVRAGLKEEIRARYLVGCDGGNSAVRKCAGIAFAGETRDKRFTMFGNLDVEGLEPTCFYSWSDSQKGFMALNPMPLSNTWFFSAPLQPDEHGEAPVASMETFQNIFDTWPGTPRVKFSNPLYLSIYRLNIRMVDRYRSGRVFVAGDAAHVHPPAGGQGMNTGIQDAHNLGWKLAYVLQGAPEALLETYQAERLPIAQEVLATSTSRILSWTETDANGTSAGVEGITKMIHGKDPFSDTTQLSVNYRGSSLARDLTTSTGIRAGDRAPDALCQSAQNREQVRLFDVFRGTHFTLLAFGNQHLPKIPAAYQDLLQAYTVTRAASPALDTAHLLLDSEEQAYQAYGITTDALILVRPDGYIGLTAAGTAYQAIFDYLHEISAR